MCYHILPHFTKGIRSACWLSSRATKPCNPTWLCWSPDREGIRHPFHESQSSHYS
jgi:hypothetical protein